MTDGIRNRSAGLSLAYQHRSAVGQAKTETVYKNLRKAFALDAHTAPSTRQEVTARALRGALDRVRRLGERVSENVRVAPRDHDLMVKEYVHLREQVVRMLSRANGPVPLLDDQSQLDLATERQQIGRLVDAVFRGEIRPADKIDQRADLIDPDRDPKEILLDGVFELKDRIAYAARNAIDSLTDGIDSRNHRRTLALDGKVAGDQWATKAIAKVRDDILLTAQTATHTAMGTGDTLKNAALFLSGF